MSNHDIDAIVRAVLQELGRTAEVSRPVTGPRRPRTARW